MCCSLLPSSKKWSRGEVGVSIPISDSDIKLPIHFFQCEYADTITCFSSQNFSCPLAEFTRIDHHLRLPFLPLLFSVFIIWFYTSLYLPGRWRLRFPDLGAGQVCASSSHCSFCSPSQGSFGLFLVFSFGLFLVLSVGVFLVVSGLFCEMGWFFYCSQFLI